jgi:hypothetical protein
MDSMFAKDPEIVVLPMGIDDNKLVYMTPEPFTSPLNLIPDNVVDANFRAGRMLEQDALSISKIIEPTSNRSDGEELVLRKLHTAVENRLRTEQD